MPVSAFLYTCSIEFHLLSGRDVWDGDEVPGRLRVKHSDAEVVELLVAQRWLDCHGTQARAWLDQVPGIARWWAVGPCAGDTAARRLGQRRLRG
jgi:hypothetical protein